MKIEAQWYEKTALYAALKTALRAGTAPDIFYAEPDQVEYMENALLLDLSSLNWAGVEPWAKEIWSYKGKPYGLPLEANTVELYYNKKLLADLGVKVPASLQLDSQAMIDLAKKARGKEPHADVARRRRPAVSPGAYLVQESMLKKLGRAGLRQPAEGQAVVDRPARARHAAPDPLVDRGGHAAHHVHHAQAWRGAQLLPHQPGRGDHVRLAAGTPPGRSIRRTRAASRRTSRSAS